MTDDLIARARRYAADNPDRSLSAPSQAYEFAVALLAEREAREQAERERDRAVTEWDRQVVAALGFRKAHAQAEARVADLEAALRDLADDVITRTDARAALGEQEAAPPESDLIAWIYKSGYPYDWSTSVPLPERYRRPLAEYAFAQEWPNGSDTETVDDWYGAMASEGNWPAWAPQGEPEPPDYSQSKGWRGPTSSEGNADE